jgi:hypothetical protein
MSVSKTAVERIKNIVIVVLVISAILLLYFLWDNSARIRLRLPTLGLGASISIKMQEIIMPEKIIVNFGSENYTVLSSTDEIWYYPADDKTKSFINALKDMAMNETTSQSLISEKDYDEVVRNRSIQADFPFAIPLREYGVEFGIKQLERMDIIDTFTTLVYSEASPESFFIGNKQEDKYYRLTTQNELNDFKDIIAAIEKIQNTYFYPLRTFAGVDNQVMLPLDLSINIPDVRYYKHDVWSDTDNSSGLNDLAKLYFGESFDFTRKVTEGNGAIVYVYGYGEKVLVIKTDGTFEYSSKSDVSGSAGFFDALRTALEFIVKHSEPGIISSAGNNIYLKDVVRTSDGSGGFKFIFGFKAEGRQVLYEKSDPIVIEVIGQNVVYSTFDEIVLRTVDSTETETEACPPFEILVEHYQYIFDTLKETKGFDKTSDGVGVSEDETLDVFNAVMENVSDVSTGYLRRSFGETSGELVPVWRIRISETDFYFNMISGEPEGNSAEIKHILLQY